MVCRKTVAETILAKLHNVDMDSDEFTNTTAATREDALRGIPMDRLVRLVCSDYWDIFAPRFNDVYRSVGRAIGDGGTLREISVRAGCTERQVEVVIDRVGAGICDSIVNNINSPFPERIFSVRVENALLRNDIDARNLEEVKSAYLSGRLEKTGNLGDKGQKEVLAKLIERGMLGTEVKYDNGMSAFTRKHRDLLKYKLGDDCAIDDVRKEVMKPEPFNGTVYKDDFKIIAKAAMAGANQEYVDFVNKMFPTRTAYSSKPMPLTRTTAENILVTALGLDGESKEVTKTTKRERLDLLQKAGSTSILRVIYDCYRTTFPHPIPTVVQYYIESGDTDDIKGVMDFYALVTAYILEGYM